RRADLFPHSSHGKDRHFAVQAANLASHCRREIGSTAIRARQERQISHVFLPQRNVNERQWRFTHLAIFSRTSHPYNLPVWAIVAEAQSFTDRVLPGKISPGQLFVDDHYAWTTLGIRNGEVASL